MRSLPILEEGDSRRQSPGVAGAPQRLAPDARAGRSEWPVALVSMPWGTIVRPNIQIGLLQSIAASHGFPVETFHLNLELATLLGPEVYEAIASHIQLYLGEWLFSVAAFGTAAPDAEARYLEEFRAVIERTFAAIASADPRGAPSSNGTVERLRAIRDSAIPRYLDQMIETIPWGRFRVVGFTSTFQQHTPSIALATRIKQRWPSTVIVFGGSNLDGEMGEESVRSLPAMDYAVIGEGDVAFPELLIALQEGRDPATVPGVACRRRGQEHVKLARPPLADLDGLPHPNYDEFFARAESLGLLSPGPRRVVRLPIEAARGCWWGAKHHCTFCGLNGSTLTYRSKSAGRLLAEMADLTVRYRSFSFTATDNILDHRYLTTLMPELRRRQLDFDLFFEVKANMTREQIRLLHEAGVSRVQPGIESFNTHLLTLMNKGVTGLQNVNTLRWCQYYGISVGWNLLFGFPGESLADYAAQVQLLRQLTHLSPPSNAGRICLTRFSPLFEERGATPLRGVRALPAYGFIYPASFDLDRLAYAFEFDDGLPESAYAETKEQVARWQTAWREDRKPWLECWSAPGFLQIEDARDRSAVGTYAFEGPLAALYLSCSDRPRTAATVKDTLHLPWTAKEIEDALAEFCARGLMLREDDHFLSLALPATPGR